jgi:hypothetical protein
MGRKLRPLGEETPDQGNAPAALPEAPAEDADDDAGELDQAPEAEAQVGDDDDGAEAEPDIDPDTEPDIESDDEANSSTLPELSAEAKPDIPVDIPHAAGRDDILRAFKRNGSAASQPQPAPAQPANAQRAPSEPQPTRVWFAGSREPRRESTEFTNEAWEEFVAGFRYGTLKWNRARLGPEPGNSGCRAPRHILPSFGLT